MWRAGAQLGMIARALARHPVPPPGFSDGLRTDARLYPSPMGWVRALQTQPSGAAASGLLSTLHAAKSVPVSSPRLRTFASGAHAGGHSLLRSSADALFGHIKALHHTQLLQPQLLRRRHSASESRQKARGKAAKGGAGRARDGILGGPSAGGRGFEARLRPAGAAHYQRTGGEDGHNRAKRREKRRDTASKADAGGALASGYTPEYLESVMDLQMPATWYPAARALRRRVVLHVGPTNSGKTYTALKRLREAPSGVYCGPLRLLAWEVADAVNSSGVPCNLITGQERREHEGARHTACTVEMTCVNRQWDCAVVDEIHLLGDPSRGWGFTRALLGLNTRELHLCGSPAAVDIVRKLCADCGDDLEVEHYERLSPLQVSKKPLKSLAHVQKGDCLVAFSRAEIFGIKRLVERETALRCCVVYGSLPPEARARQARLFNEQSHYDVLVASDAVGMGLNLNIGRIVFTRMEKFDGQSTRRLLPSEALQIGGRAGRFQSKFPVGHVTTLDKSDQVDLKELMASKAEEVRSAGVFPTFALLKLCAYVHNECLIKALEMFEDEARVSENYFLTSLEEMLELAKMLRAVPLSLDERLLFCTSPVSVTDTGTAAALLAFATDYHAKGRVRSSVLHRPPMHPPKDEEELRKYEGLHRQYDLYLWLGQRLEHAFPDMALATSQRELIAECIAEGLQLLGDNRKATKKLRKLVRRKLESIGEGLAIIEAQHAKTVPAHGFTDANLVAVS